MGKRQQRTQPRKNVKKENAFTLLFKSFGNLRRGFEETKKSQRKPKAHCRSFAPRTLTRYEESMEAMGVNGEYLMDSERFYDVVVGTSPHYPPAIRDDQPLLSTDKRRDRVVPASKPASRREKPSKGLRSGVVAPEGQSGFRLSGTRRASVRPAAMPTTAASSRRRKPDSGADDERPMVTDDEDETDLVPDWLEGLYDNSDRHSLGIGLLSKVFGSGKATDTAGYEEDRDSRPFFTYWITLVQVIVFIVVIAIYGVGPISPSTKTISDLVLMTTLVTEQQSYEEIGNMWIGPRQQDLIHVGAKYSLCMRLDTNLQALLDAEKQAEKAKACCFNNDGSGCVMSKQGECNSFISTWLKYPTLYSPIEAGRTSGAVCGQDPGYCGDPYTNWPDDISQWPKCSNRTAVVANSSNPSILHMSCEVLGRPCCIGIKGQCILATRQYCTFRRGYFHEDATLCSQVDCVSDICGMIPFANSTEPDQFYRLFSNMFLHAGLFDLVLTLVIQLIFMRDLEKLISSWRVVIIYLGSGVAGSLAGATFIPYYVEAGPAGAQFGILAALFIEVLRFERRVKNAQIWKTIIKMLAAIGVLFIFGLIFPQVDNYSHLFGLFFGGLIAFGLRPYQVMCDRKLDDCPGITIKVIVAITCILLAAGVFVITVILFYVSPIHDCNGCMYFNCIPFTSTYCSGMSVNLTLETVA